MKRTCSLICLITVGFIVFFYGCSLRFISGGNLEAKGPTVNINNHISKRCSEIYSGIIVEDITLKILSSGDVSFDLEKIKEAYYQMITIEEKMMQKKIPNRNFQLIILSFENKPEKYKYVDLTSKTETSLVLIDKNSSDNATETILCEIFTEAHELMHSLLDYPAMRSRMSIRSTGWFEEGCACYAEYTVAECTSGIRCEDSYSDKAKAIEALCDDKIREYVFTSFSPPIESYDLSKKSKKMSKDEKITAWKRISDGYNASLGIFIFFEKKLGKEKLYEIMREMQGKHEYQDEAFYEDLASKVGFDIRKVTKQEIEKTFEERN